MSENLLAAIKNIRENSKWDIPQKSDKIMERLRGETIFISENYKKEIECKQGCKQGEGCTIDPQKKLPISINQVEEGLVDDSVLDIIRQGVIQIKANSFGPYFPNEYFKDNTLRVLWLLKEPYIKNDSFDAGDRGGHNQADEYLAGYMRNKCLGSSGETQQKVLECTREILTALGEISEDTSTEEVLKHICILEVNHFPGLAFKSKSILSNNNIGEWSVTNEALLKQLIDFYNPDILIGAFTLQDFYNVKDHDYKSLKKSIDKGNNDLLSKLGIRVDDIKIPQGSRNYVFKALLESNKKPLYVIHAYHPCYNRFGLEYKADEAKCDGVLMNKLGSTVK